MKKIIILIVLSLLFTTTSKASPPARSFTYTTGQIIEADKVTTNEDNIYNYLTTGVDTIADGTIVNADISAAAAIDASKLSNISTAGKVSGAALTNLNLTPSAAGVIPKENLTSVAQKGANSDITSLSGLTNVSGLGAIGGGTTNRVVLTTDGSALSMGQANLTTMVTGTLPVGNGGTGATAAANAANGVVVLNGSSQLPAVDGSLLTGLATGDMSYANARFKVGMFIRDASGSTADVAYTSVGFTPKAIIVHWSISGVGIGFSDGTTEGYDFVKSDGTGNYGDAKFIEYISGANKQTGTIKSFDADGFTLTWTKTNSPTGTITAYYVAYR